MFMWFSGPLVFGGFSGQILSCGLVSLPMPSEGHEYLDLQSLAKIMDPILPILSIWGYSAIILGSFGGPGTYSRGWLQEIKKLLLGVAFEVFVPALFGHHSLSHPTWAEPGLW